MQYFYLTQAAGNGNIFVYTRRISAEDPRTGTALPPDWAMALASWRFQVASQLFTDGATSTARDVESVPAPGEWTDRPLDNGASSRACVLAIAFARDGQTQTAVRAHGRGPSEFRGGTRDATATAAAWRPEGRCVAGNRRRTCVTHSIGGVC
jgi:hypothetical protein